MKSFLVITEWKSVTSLILLIWSFQKYNFVWKMRSWKSVVIIWKFTFKVFTNFYKFNTFCTHELRIDWLHRKINGQRFVNKSRLLCYTKIIFLCHCITQWYRFIYNYMSVFNFLKFSQYVLSYSKLVRHSVCCATNILCKCVLINLNLLVFKLFFWFSW